MKSQFQMQREMDSEGKAIAKDVAEQIAKVEAKLDKQNQSWLKSGDAKVNASQTEAMAAAVHKAAARVMRRK